MLGLVCGNAEISDVDLFLNRLKEIRAEYDVTIQAFDARKIAGRRHIEVAVDRAIRSMDRGENISKDLGMEILLYASGRRNINRAIEIGISKAREIVIVIVGDNVKRAEEEVKQEISEDDVLEYEDSKKEETMRFFDITEEELDAVGEEKIVDIVIERVVLLDVIK